jgi:tetratricopeptide (TPR) repeat protein
MRKLYFFQITLLLCLPGLLSAESVTLKSGKVIEGRITEQTGAYIKIESDGAPLYFERKFISAIDEEKKTEAQLFKEGLKWGSEGQFDKALDAFQQGFAINPESRNLKEVLQVLQDLKAGVLEEEYALHLFKGSYYLTEAQFEQALVEFKAALEISPDPDLYYYLGVCTYSLGRYEDALDFLRKAEAQIGPDAEIYYQLGITSYALRQYSQAVQWMRKLLELEPEDAESRAVLGTCLFLLGEKAQAKEELNRSLELFRKQGDYLKASDVETFMKEINL